MKLTELQILFHWPDAMRNHGRMPCETMAGCHAKPWPDVMRNHGRMSCETVAGCHAHMQRDDGNTEYSLFI